MEISQRKTSSDVLKSDLENLNASNLEPILIEKYPNRRLYNTATSIYIVLDDFVKLINEDTWLKNN